MSLLFKFHFDKTDHVLLYYSYDPMRKHTDEDVLFVQGKYAVKSASGGSSHLKYFVEQNLK